MTLEELFPKGWVFDVETMRNLFTVVFRKLGTKQYERFVIHAEQDETEQLIDFLTEEQPILIGFNNIAFDAQVIEEIFKHSPPAEKIYTFTQELIERQNEDRFYNKYSEWDLSFRQIDLYKQNHYDNTSRSTSLKWLEFTMRWHKMADLPFEHTKDVSKSNISKVLSYNRNDVDVTYEFFYRCEAQTKLRMELVKKYRSWRIMSMSDASMGSYIFKQMLSEEIPKEKLKKTSPRGKIYLRDCLLHYVSFTDSGFQAMLDKYRETIINVAETGLKGVINHKLVFDDMEFSFGTGGIHAAYKPGIYESDEEWEILSIDGKSYYPWLIIANRFFPEHLGETYCDIYKKVYEMRTTYEKGTAMNYALKILLNSVYGKSNSEFSYLYDPKLTLKITVNGQLLLAMLAERLSSVGRLLLVNTDGLEIMIRKRDRERVREICEQWEVLTGITLEENNYKKIVIRDVNSYIALDLEGKAKRKGFFTTWNDITGEDGGEHSFHSNPSASIISQALFNYYAYGRTIEDTIYNTNDIYEFLYAIKGKRNFDYWFITSSRDGVVDIDKRTDRVLRYYISREGANIYKHFHDNRATNPVGVNRGQLVSLAMNISDKDISGVVKSGKYAGEPLDAYSNLNLDHYVNEAYKTKDEIEARKESQGA